MKNGTSILERAVLEAVSGSCPQPLWTDKAQPGVVFSNSKESCSSAILLNPYVRKSAGDMWPSIGITIVFWEKEEHWTFTVRRGLQGLRGMAMPYGGVA